MCVTFIQWWITNMISFKSLICWHHSCFVLYKKNFNPHTQKMKWTPHVYLFSFFGTKPVFLCAVCKALFPKKLEGEFLKTFYIDLQLLYVLQILASCSFLLLTGDWESLISWLPQVEKALLSYYVFRVQSIYYTMRLCFCTLLKL